MKLESGWYSCKKAEGGIKLGEIKDEFGVNYKELIKRNKENIA